MGEHVVIVVDLIGELADVADIPAVGLLHLVDHTVDEGGDGIDKRHLGALFKVTALTVLHPQHQGCQFFSALLQ